MFRVIFLFSILWCCWFWWSTELAGL